MTTTRTAGLILVASLVACDGPGGPAVLVQVTDSAGVEIVTNLLTEPLPTCEVTGPEVSIGELDGPEEYQLYRVFGARRLSDGRIVLMNRGSGELRLYDSTGVFLHRAGREGAGPGEFRRGDGIWPTAGDSIWVGDLGRPWRYHVFDATGTWSRTVQPSPPLPFDPALVTVLEDGSSVAGLFVIAALTPALTPHEVTPVLYDPGGSVVDTLGAYPMGRYARVGEGRATVTVAPHFDAATSLDGARRSIFVGYGGEAEVSELEVGAEGLRVSRKVRWTPGDRTIQPADVDSVRARIRRDAAGAPPGALENLVGPARGVAELFPAFDAIAANRAGGFWVRRYPRPRDGGPRRWLAFDAAGRFECQLELPVGQVVDLGRDYMLVKHESDLGVERIALYRFGLPRGAR